MVPEGLPNDSFESITSDRFWNILFTNDEASVPGEAFEILANTKKLVLCTFSLGVLNTESNSVLLCMRWLEERDFVGLAIGSST